jgi:hypothetical protein
MPDFTVSNPYERPGVWLRGNLHTHTTNSDGRGTPEATAEWYASHGYDFLAITDHHRITAVEGSFGDLVLIPGAEVGKTDVVALGIREPLVDERGDIGESVRLVQGLGGVPFLAHPYWAGLSAATVAQYPGLIGLEVYNNVCQLLNGKGLSAYIWDELLQSGVRLWGLATDDAHGLDDSRFARTQVGQAWAVVKAARKGQEPILRALCEGAFYSTRGPSILDIKVTEAGVEVECSPVREIRFIGRASEGTTVHASGERLLERAEHRLRGAEGYIRIECVDDGGRTAWSNPLWLETRA